MPRTCLACKSPERKEIDKAIVAGEPLRSIAKRVSISAAGLLRHKPHVAGAIVKAQERREEKLGDNILDGIRQLQVRGLGILDKMESEGDHRGSILAIREMRECLLSIDGLLAKAQDGGTRDIRVEIVHVGGGS